MRETSLKAAIILGFVVFLALTLIVVTLTDSYYPTGATIYEDIYGPGYGGESYPEESGGGQNHQSQTGGFVILASGTSFNSTWNTSESGVSNNDQVKLPLESGGTYDFTVYWGDGNSDNITAWNQTETTHTYAAAGVYNISINGTIRGFRFNNGGDKDKILDISNWGDLDLISNSVFYGCSNLDVSATDAPTLSTTSLYSMFRNSGITTANLSTWDTSSVTAMHHMFQGATSANPDTSNWDTSSVTNMWYMFHGATSANPNTSNWDTSSVTRMDYMFRSATSANPDTSNWDTSSVTRMEYMFFRATSANPNTSNWDTSSVTNMRDMFHDATSANPDTSNWNTSSVSTMAVMFQGATSANPDTSNWDTSSVTHMGFMFFGATSANPNTSNWDTSSVTNMYSMFRDATSANPNTSNWDTSSVTHMRDMFHDATSANPDTSNWDTSSVTHMGGMFHDATSANPDTSNWDTSSVTAMWFMFRDATSANPDTSNWDTSSVTSMEGMFHDATSANPNTSNWDTSSVTTMVDMFRSATSANPDTSNWNVSSLRNASLMFLNSNLSTYHYDLLLIGWAGQSPNLQTDVPFSAGSTNYCVGESARNLLTSPLHNWSITDGGKDCTLTCGNTVVDPGEECDDGNLIGGDACSITCTCEDADSDGYNASFATCGVADCNDTNLFVYPGAPEICNDVDDDCDTLVDENALGCTTYYSDEDGDAYGNATDSRCLCAPEDPYNTTNDTDCDDSNADINPGAEEICDDSLDNDCDGDIDCEDSGCLACSEEEEKAGAVEEIIITPPEEPEENETDDDNGEPEYYYVDDEEGPETTEEGFAGEVEIPRQNVTSELEKMQENLIFSYLSYPIGIVLIAILVLFLIILLYKRRKKEKKVEEV